MAKRILLSVLVNVLGDFVEGLTEENLAVGLWSGKLVLNNVKLNRRLIEQMNWSVHVEYGFVETLEVTIPWTGLERQPVKILISGVYLLVTASDFSQLTQADVFERNSMIRTAELSQSEKSMELAMQMSSVQSDNAKDSSYFQRLTEKIIDNLEVELCDVHLRYEDSISIPGCRFACGITLDKFSISTTDSTWNESFVARKRNNLIHKLARATNVGIYWNCLNSYESSDVSFSSLTFERWKKSMSDCIFKPDKTPQYHLEYILLPPNTFTMKLIHNDAEGAVPKLNVSVESSNLALCLDKVQYHEVMRMKTHAQFLQRKQRLLHCRPATSAKHKPRAWWKYALILLTNREDILTNKMDVMMACCRYRSRYISLLVARKTLNEETGELYELTHGQSAELAGIEEIIPIVALTVFRQLAARESFLKNASIVSGSPGDVIHNNIEHSESSSEGGWLSWFGYYDSNHKEGNETVEEMYPSSMIDINIADTLLHSSSHDALSYTVDVELNSHATLVITSCTIPVATLDTGLHLSSTVRASMLQIYFAMTNLQLTDNITPGPVIKDILRVRISDSSTEQQVSPFSILINCKPDETEVKVSAMPVEICLNKHCIKQLLSTFHVPNNDPPAVIDKVVRKYRSAFDVNVSNIPSRQYGSEPKDGQNASLESYRAPDSINITVDIESPKIIVPEDSSRDIGCLSLDTGHLIVKGSLTAAGMSWAVSLRSINAEMPKSAGEIGNSDKEYLIRPFGIDVLVQDINQSKADMTVEVEVTPCIRGEVDSLKLSRLMHLIQVVSSTFDLDEAGSGLDRLGLSFDSPTSFTDSDVIDPTRPSLSVSVLVPIIALTLNYPDDSSHHGFVTVTSLSASVDKRPYDTVMLFDLGALSIEDSERIRDQRYLVQTPSSPDSVLVRISFVSISNKKSPHFQLHSNEVIVEFAKLNLFLDSKSILFLRPFYEVILGKRLSEYLPEKTPNYSGEMSLLPPAALPDDEAVLETAPSADISIHCVVSLQIISLEILRCEKPSHSPTNREPSDGLKSVTIMDIESLGADVVLTDTMEYEVRIQAVHINDSRQVSRDYQFRTLFCPGTHKEDQDIVLVDAERKDQSQIIIKFNEDCIDGVLKKQFNIAINDLTGYISLDTILDVLDVTLENSDAVLELIAPVPTETPISDRPVPDKDSREVLKVNVSVPCPKLFFLEDPTSLQTKAVVAKCSIGYEFIREVIQSRTTEINQSINVSLTDIELYVLLKMTKWKPRRILDPMNVDYFTKRSEENQIITSEEYNLNVDSLTSRVSLSDILLTQAIFTRRTLLDMRTTLPEKKKHDLDNAVTFPVNSGLTSVTAYNVLLHVDMISLVIINDFKGKNLPILQGTLQSTKFSADGVLQNLSGCGSFVVHVESFNSHISEWETVVDRWSPSLQLSSGSSTGTVLSVVSPDTLQFTLSSTFMESLLKAQSLLFLTNDSPESNRGQIPSVIVKNELGLPVNMLLENRGEKGSSTENVLFRLEAGDEARLYSLQRSDDNVYTADKEVIERKGPLGAVFSTIPSMLHVELLSPSGVCFCNQENSQVSKGLSLQLRRRVSLDVSFPIEHQSFKKQESQSSPITEEVYENQRYAPLLGSWVEPFLVNDPDCWSSIDGRKKGKGDVKLPEGWEWLSDWKIDRWSHRVGFDIDEDGFEYALRFGSFSPGKPRLCSALDCVRRRRWVRTRAPMVELKSEESVDQLVSPGSYVVKCIWDSRRLEDGSKEIVLRSSRQIHNKLPYDILVRVQNNSWENEYIEFGPLARNSTMSVPLALSNANSMEVKPLGKGEVGKFEWSQSIDLNSIETNSTSYQDLLCVKALAKAEEGRKQSRLMNNLPIRAKIVTDEDCLSISLSGYLDITNSLPCPVQYRCFNCFDLKNIEKSVICAEEGTLSAGQDFHPTYISLLYNTFVSFRVGNYSWSSKILMTRLSRSSSNSDMTRQDVVEFKDDSGEVGLLLRLDIKTDPQEAATFLRIFSKFALIDRTGLSLCVRSRVHCRSHEVGHTRTFDMIRASRKHTAYINKAFRSDQEKQDKICSSVQLVDFAVKSSNSYTVAVGSTGAPVHTDRSHSFSFLPPALNTQTYVVTPCEDRAIASDTSGFMQFKIEVLAIVCVLVNKATVKPPRWLRKGGFCLLLEQAISTENGIENYYAIYGKLYQPKSQVSLGSNYSKDVYEMYSVFVLAVDEREGCNEILEQLVNNSEEARRVQVEKAWGHGNSGLTLFDAKDEYADIGTDGGVAWTRRAVALNTLGTSAKGDFEIHDKSLSKIYDLAYNVQSLPGRFACSKVVTIMPKYCLVNCLDEAVEVCQTGGSDVLLIEPYRSVGWHRHHYSRDSTIKLRLPTTEWSFGAVDVNEIGTSSLLLPELRRRETTNKCSYSVLNFEIRVADPSDMCMVCITLWKSKSVEMSPFSIRNDSDAPLVVRQRDITFNSLRLAESFQIVVPPNEWLSYGWTDSNKSKKILIAAGETSLSNSSRSMAIDVLKHNRKVRLPVATSPTKKARGNAKEVVLTVESHGGGVVVHAYHQRDIDKHMLELQEGAEEEATQSLENCFALSLKLSTIGISIVADSPIRREMFSLYAEDTMCSIKHAKHASAIEFSIQDMQVDNYCETHVHPVLLRRVHSPPSLHDERKDCAEPPFIYFVSVQDARIGSSMPVVCKYASLRVLEFVVEVDSGSMQLFYTDFLHKLNLVSQDQALAQFSPREWVDEFNVKLLSSESRMQLVDPYKAQLRAQQPKIMFENLIIHPIRVSLTFLHTDMPVDRRQQTSISRTALRMLTSLVAVELMAIKLNSFIVNGAVESMSSLLSRIEEKALQDVKSQIAQMAGSLTFLGSPVGLARNIGNGVEAFFYEPYQGLVLGPQDFLRGLGRGTSSLVAGVVGGTLTSTAALVSSASSGLSYLSGDSEFVRDRSAKMQRLHASRFGAIEGICGGGDLVVSGFTNGLAGLFQKPLEGAQSSGAGGFVKGIGLGMAGALVKPTLGLADGFSSAATGISNEVGSTAPSAHVRPARALQRSQTDPSVRVLTSVSLSAAQAQHLVHILNQKATNEAKDEYIANFKLGNEVHAVISQLKLIVLYQSRVIRLLRWREVSHCSLSRDFVGVWLYNARSDKNPVKLYFKPASRGVSLYLGLLHHSYLMGNPSATLPLDRNSLVSTGGPSDQCSGLQSLGYEFGTAVVPSTDLLTGSEQKLLQAAKARLGSGEASLGAIDSTGSWLAMSYARSCDVSKASRCCVVILLNKSADAISLVGKHLSRGRVLHVVEAPGYDKPAHRVHPKSGFVMLLACGSAPSFYDSGDVSVSLQTSAFTATISQDPKETCITNVSKNCRVGFLEKTATEWWSKYCILVT